MKSGIILIADDSATSRNFIRKTLVLAGVAETNIFQAANGKEAMEAMSSQSVELLFLDINMPVMTGIEVIEQMAERKMMENTAVVVTSSEGNKNRIDYLKSKGIYGFVRKPFTPEMCRDILEKVRR